MNKYSFILGCTVLMSACSLAPTKLKEGLFLNNQVQYAGIESIAHSSSNVIDFASKVYTRQPYKKDAEFVIVEKQWLADRTFLDQKINNIDDQKIFFFYCNAKNGELYQWNADRLTSSFGGINKRFFVCETNSKIESALLFESTSNKSTIYPYEVSTTYVDDRYMERMFKIAKASGFASSNKMIILPQTNLRDPANKSYLVSNTFSAIFTYKNTTQRPVEINLENSFVTLAGARDELGRYSGKKVISWNKYNDGGQNVFIGENKLRFNPGQELKGDFIFEVPGLSKLTEENMDDFALQLDGIIFDGFKLASYYDMGKIPVPKTAGTSRSATR